MSVPIDRHVAIAIIDGMAQVVLASQLGPLMPTRLSTSLKRPVSGWSRKRHTTATATMLVTTGM